MIQHGFNLFMLGAIAKKYRGNVEKGMTRKEETLFSFLKQLVAPFKERRSVSIMQVPFYDTKTFNQNTGRTY